MIETEFTRVQNCQFTYKCPLDWESLQPTNKQNVKHCQTCNRSVQLCLTPQQLEQAATTGLCVAYTEKHLTTVGEVRVISGE